MADERDKWADWLVRGRSRGLDDTQVRQMERHLVRIRDRVLKGAKIRKGNRVLDVGAGTGLLALGARKRVKETGRVIAVDISSDALVECGSEIEPVLGDVLALPFRDESFDVVLTRSVLIYVEDKPASVRELGRVLKQGGRASIFEPINDVGWTFGHAVIDSGFFDPVQPTHGQIIARYGGGPVASFHGWDERDLARWFDEAGFTRVELTYEYSLGRGRAPSRSTTAARDRVRRRLQQRPNPYDPSYEEHARDLLGSRADAYLDSYVDFLLRTPPPHANGEAYLIAQR